MIKRREDDFVRSRRTGGLAWWFGLLAAAAGLILCLLLPWATDVLPGGWQWTGRRPAGDAFGSVTALRTNDLGGGWPADALHAAVAVSGIWIVALLTGVVRRLRRRTTPQQAASRRWPAVLALVLVPLTAAAIAVTAVRAVGVHALPAFAALPVPLVVGAVVSIAWLVPRRPGSERRALAATMAGVLVVAAATVPFVRWYTGSRLVGGTTSGRPPSSAGPAPARPGKVAWQLASPQLDPVVSQRAGYTVVTYLNDDPHGERDGEVHVYDSATGRERWHFRRADAVLSVAGLTGETLDVEATDLRGHATLYGFDVAGGHRRWSRQEPYPAASRPADFGPVSDGALLYTMESATPALFPKVVDVRSATTGGELARLSPGCAIDDAQAASDLLVVRCGPLLSAYRGLHAVWNIRAPGTSDRRHRMRLGDDVLAVPDNPAGNTTDWTVYRTSDGRRLWAERAPRELFLTGGRVVELTASGTLAVREASTGHTLWRGVPARLHLPPGGDLDGVVGADGRLYAMWAYRADHVSLVTFDARSGDPAGVTDVTGVIGDPCPLTGWDRVRSCALQQLDAAGGGVVLLTATLSAGGFRAVVYALTDGAGFTSVQP